ncbi:Mediator of RNA polymerase II transcription subunit 15a [Glycine max]|nr:Mediator of RNA polymerase II transcription subunit 15a [Glycine max]
MLFAKTAIVVVGDLGDTLGSNTGPLIQEKAETILISSPLDSTAQTGQSSGGGGDWQEQIKSMKESYLPELNEMYQKIATQLQQHNSLPTQPKLDQLEKMNVFKMLERIIAFLQVSKSNISPNFKEKLEKDIRKLCLQCSQGNFPYLILIGNKKCIKSEIFEVFNLIFKVMIKSMKENYLPELNEMYQKSASKLQRHTSLPQQPKSYKLEKLKKFMKMLECAIAFLQVSKSNISLNYRLKLDSCEKQIIKIININRPNKIVPPLQYGQFPPPHMQSH